MIEVPIDKIIPLEEATLEIKKILEGIRDTDIYVITKDGKPHAAIIDIDYLEHLPEIESAGQTKKINDIGESKEGNYNDFKVQTENDNPTNPANPVSPNVSQETPQAQNTPQSNPVKPSEQNIQPEVPEETEVDSHPEIGKKPEIIQDNMGPWKDQADQDKENDPSNPPDDLNIG